MNVGILLLGEIDPAALDRIIETLNSAVPKSATAVISEHIPTPQEAFDHDRKQYRSDIILETVRKYAEKSSFDTVLGIVDTDMFAPGLNFVFGQANCPGKAAVISLWRLRPQFYGQTLNNEKFYERSAKEAVHEIGHTLGIGHCANPFCVMHFSNSILETDVKKTFYCNKCSAKAETTIRKHKEVTTTKRRREPSTTAKHTS